MTTFADPNRFNKNNHFSYNKKFWKAKEKRTFLTNSSNSNVAFVVFNTNKINVKQTKRNKLSKIKLIKFN